ncbi:hypothetical protein SDC9_170031 [bioreactor metagenome]|uniref:Uncharacterized protein n=1 Tax=bioreactor metagenome TaxID=1076179 RepID=A0A645G6Y6_9ZZZZ
MNDRHLRRLILVAGSRDEEVGFGSVDRNTGLGTWLQTRCRIKVDAGTSAEQDADAES